MNQRKKENNLLSEKTYPANKKVNKIIKTNKKKKEKKRRESTTKLVHVRDATPHTS